MSTDLMQRESMCVKKNEYARNSDFFLHLALVLLTTDLRHINFANRERRLM
jgi:hypothetical protein